jgi:hypothetical protein
MTPSPRLLASAAAGGLALLVVATTGPAFADGHGKHGDPAGNNGTIKVDGVPFDDGHDNEPHVGCEFRIAFWGFDADQRGDITITGQAPSGSGVVSDRKDLLVSDDAAGGGNDPDATFTYGMSDLDLSGLKAHPKQGYHVKITFSTDTPGGVKHKVIWVQPCVTETASPTPSVLPTETESPTPTPIVTESGSPTPTPEVSASLIESPTPTVSPAVTPSVLGVKITKPGGTKPGANVLGTKLTRPLGLAFTGSYAALLATVGALALVLGGLVLVLARRRRLT